MDVNAIVKTAITIDELAAHLSPTTARCRRLEGVASKCFIWIGFSCSSTMGVRNSR